QHLSRTGSFGCNASSGEMFWSDETFRIFGYDRATKPAVEAFLERVHPEDKARVQEQISRCARGRSRSQRTLRRHYKLGEIAPHETPWPPLTGSSSSARQLPASLGRRARRGSC